MSKLSIENLGSTFWRERSFEALVENAPDIIARFDPEFRHLYVNRAVTRATGRPSSDFIGKTNADLGMPRGLVDQWDSVLRRVFTTGEEDSSEFAFTTPEGKTIWYWWRAIPEFGADGKIDTVITIARDISDAKAAEAGRVERERREAVLQIERRLRTEAESATAAKDRLLAAVSHELRSPLTAISGWLQILEGEGSEELRALAFRSMRTAVATQKRLVDDLLDAVRFARGNVQLDVETVDLQAVVHEVCETMAPLATESGVALTVEAPSPIPVIADRLRIAQVVANLLANALKFTPDGGIVTVRARRVESKAILEVTDTGCGIESEFLPLVFEKFSQARGPRTNQGLGLGLSIVRDIVQLHGGKVDASSDGAGKGACFRVTLPASRDSSVTRR